MNKIRIPRETRICLADDCDNTFEVRITCTKKYCSKSCNNRNHMKKLWQDPEYVRMQHEARLGRAGWSKGLTKETHPSIAVQVEKRVGRKQSKESNKKRSEALKGKSYTEIYGEERAREMIEVRRAARKGDKSPFWRGGVWDDLYLYPEEFVQARKEVKVRDNYLCQLCGKTEIDEKKDLGRGLPVHHIDYDKQNSDQKNLVTLCCSCHGRVNVDRKYWQKFFETMMCEKVLIS